MKLKEIRKLIAESRREGGITALENYDKTRELSFQKEIVSFTIKRNIMEEFRKKHSKEMSKIVEAQIEEFLRKERQK